MWRWVNAQSNYREYRSLKWLIHHHWPSIRRTMIGGRPIAQGFCFAIECVWTHQVTLDFKIQFYVFVNAVEDTTMTEVKFSNRALESFGRLPSKQVFFKVHSEVKKVVSRKWGWGLFLMNGTDLYNILSTWLSGCLSTCSYSNHHRSFSRISACWR